MSRPTVRMAVRRSRAAVVLTALVALALPPAVAVAVPAEPVPAPAAPSAAPSPNGTSTNGPVTDPLDADPTDLGTPLLPSESRLDEMERTREETQDAEADGPSLAPQSIPGSTEGTYVLGPDQPQSVADALLPYRRIHAVALTANQPRDATGVPVYVVAGQAFQHPVRLAQDGLDMLESYRLTGDSAYLGVAEKDAQRLIDIRVVSREGWFYPYEFDFALHGNRNDVIAAPWFSAMAQGQALSLFARLYELTGKAEYLEAAQRTFTTLTLGPGAAGEPFVTWVDTHGHLILEEYAQLPLSRSDQTLNGHLFAVFGLYDYHRITGDAAAVPLFSGALAWVRAHYPDFRNPGWMSKYCLTHPHVVDPTYHAIHIQQFTTIAGITQQAVWADWADQLFADYPDPLITTQIRLAAGRFQAFRFDSAGQVLQSHTDAYSPATRLSVDRRIRVKGRGIHYRVSSGPFAGWFVPEQSGRAYAHVMLKVRPYAVARTAVLPAREILVRRFDNAGNTLELRRITSGGTQVSYDLVTVINGETWLRPTNGPAPYFWVRAADAGAAGQAAVAAPTITGMTVTPGALLRRGAGDRLTYTVVVDIADPEDRVRQLDVSIGTSVQGPSVARLAGATTRNSNPSTSGLKRLTAEVEVPYRLPNGALTPNGSLDVLAVVSDSAEPTVYAGRAARVGLQHQARVTTATSSSVVRKAQQFTISGTVTTFDGTPVVGTGVRISYVPAGWTRGSYAGTATTDSRGRYSLPVRAWYTGSWMAQFVGTAGSPPTFQGVWVRVS
jgi:hypothetical protein